MHCNLPPWSVGLSRSVWRVFALTVVLAVDASAQAQKELWPELDVYYRPAEHQRTFLELSASTEHEGQKNEGTVGLYQDYLMLPDAFFRGGFRETFSRRDGSYREERVVLEANATAYSTRLFRAIYRTRAEFRVVNNEYSYRIRERLHFQRTAQNPKGLALAPYGTVEIYYDSRYKTIDRLAGRVGTEMHVGGPVTLDLYLARQHNTRGTPVFVNALSVTTKLNY
jgi:hypothetical protein